MTKLRYAWKWLKEHTLEVLAMIGALVFAFLAIMSRSNKELSVKKQAEIREALKEIAEKEGRAKALEEQDGAIQEDVDAALSEVAASKRRALEIQAGVSLAERSDDEVARMFADSGL